MALQCVVSNRGFGGTERGHYHLEFPGTVYTCDVGSDLLCETVSGLAQLDTDKSATVLVFFFKKELRVSRGGSVTRNEGSINN